MYVSDFGVTVARFAAGGLQRMRKTSASRYVVLCPFSDSLARLFFVGCLLLFDRCASSNLVCLSLLPLRSRHPPSVFCAPSVRHFTVRLLLLHPRRFSPSGFCFFLFLLLAGRIRAYGLAARRFGSGAIPLGDVLKLADEAAQTGQGLLHKAKKAGQTRIYPYTRSQSFGSSCESPAFLTLAPLGYGQVRRHRATDRETKLRLSGLVGSRGHT